MHEDLIQKFNKVSYDTDLAVLRTKYLAEKVNCANDENFVKPPELKEQPNG